MKIGDLDETHLGSLATSDYHAFIKIGAEFADRVVSLENADNTRIQSIIDEYKEKPTKMLPKMTSISSKKLTLKWPALKWLGIISLFLSSCDDPKEIGSDLFSVEVGLNYTDTLTVNSSTVLIDSVYTGLIILFIGLLFPS